MPQQSHNLRDMLDDIARRKQRAGQARFGREVATGDPPRDIFAAACASVAQAFAADGYRFASSRPRFTRRVGDFIFSVSFQSSRNNVAGEYVAMSIHANVRSPTLKRWRSAHQSDRGPHDFVAGGQIGNLLKAHPWMEWNLANPGGRQVEIDSAIKAVREIALPYFAVFTDPSAVCDRLRDGDIPSIQLGDAFEFVACFRSLSAAREIASAFLSRRSDLVGKYHAHLDEFKSHGLPSYCPSAYAEVLAALSCRFQLGDLSGPATL